MDAAEIGRQWICEIARAATRPRAHARLGEGPRRQGRQHPRCFIAEAVADPPERAATEDRNWLPPAWKQGLTHDTNSRNASLESDVTDEKGEGVEHDEIALRDLGARQSVKIAEPTEQRPAQSQKSWKSRKAGTEIIVEQSVVLRVVQSVLETGSGIDGIEAVLPYGAMIVADRHEAHGMAALPERGTEHAERQDIPARTEGDEKDTAHGSLNVEVASRRT